MASPSAEADVASSRQSEGSLAQLCLKCKEEIDSSTVAATTQAKRRYHQGLDADCQECMKNYKSLTRRWKGNKKLHQWWLNLSEEDKTTWFVKEKRLSSELSAAQKRANQRKLSVSFTSTKSVGKRDATQVHFKPWALVKRDLMMEGMTKEEAISEWRRRCMSKDFKKRKISGEWCIGEFAGAIVESYNDEANEASVEALMACETSHEVKVAMEDLDNRMSSEATERFQFTGDDIFHDREAEVPEQFIENMPEKPKAAPHWEAAACVVLDMEEVERLQDQVAQAFMDIEVHAESLSTEEESKATTIGDSTKLRWKQMVAKAKMGVQAQAETVQMSFQQVESHLEDVLFKGVARKDVDPFVGKAWDVADKANKELLAWREQVEEKYAEFYKQMLQDEDIDDAKFKEGLKSFEKEVLDPSRGYKLLAKSTSELRSAVAKYTKGLQGGARAVKRDEPGDISEVSALSARLAVAFGAVADVNIKAAGSDYKPFQAYKFDFASGLEESLNKLKATKKFFEWLRSSLDKSNKDRFVGTAPGLGFLSMLHGFVKKSCATNIMAEKLQTPGIPKRYVDMFSTIYSLQASICKPNYASMSVNLYGCAEVRIVTSGSEVIGGLRLPTQESGVGYNQFAKELEGLDGASLGKRFKDKEGFLLRLEAGSIGIVPSGYLIFYLSSVGSSCFRKSISPPFETEDATVRRTCAMVLEAHPELQRTAWQTWHGFLSGQQD